MSAVEPAIQVLLAVMFVTTVLSAMHKGTASVVEVMLDEEPEVFGGIKGYNHYTGEQDAWVR